MSLPGARKHYFFTNASGLCDIPPFKQRRCQLRFT